MSDEAAVLLLVARTVQERVLFCSTLSGSLPGLSFL